jgi:PAS domain S-box-containing protein
MVKTSTSNELKQRIKDLEKERAEWQRTEDALREKEQRYRTMFDRSYQLIGLMTPDGTGLEINKTALTLMGIEESDVFDKSYWETPFWTHSEELQGRFREAVKTAAAGQIVRFEVTHIAADGTLRYIDFSLKPVKDRAGKVVLLIPEGRDITDHKLAEQALSQSKNTARALLNAPTDTFLLHDPQGIVLAANTVAAARFQKSVDELVGTNIFDLMSAPVAQSRMMRVRQVIESKMPVRFEDEHQGKTYDHNLYPILDAQGEVVQIAIYARDVTDYKQAVARLEERTTDLLNSEEKYRTLVENIPIVVYRINHAGETIFVNDVVEDIFGYRTEEIMGSPDLWYDKIHREDRPRVEELRRRSLREGKEFVAEYRVTHKGGYTTYVMDHAIPVRLANGCIGSVDGFIIDVTDTVKLQERLVRAEEIKTISEVSARLAHEIRNPLVSVGGFARRMFSSMSPDDPNKTRVQIIVKEVDRMETILRMMLSYIQPLDLTMSLVDPNSLVATVLKSLGSRIQDRKMRVDLQLSPRLQQIHIDRPRMERALDALIRNALSQMPEGGTLSVSSSSEGRSFDLIIRYPVMSVSPDDVEHFFYPFTWSGMISEIADLPLSKILVDKLGGSIEVSLNQPGELTLRVSLPY